MARFQLHLPWFSVSNTPQRRALQRSEPHVRWNLSMHYFVSDLYTNANFSPVPPWSTVCRHLQRNSVTARGFFPVVGRVG